jgi:hypothetical protein
VSTSRRVIDLVYGCCAAVWVVCNLIIVLTAPDEAAHSNPC